MNEQEATELAHQIKVETSDKVTTELYPLKKRKQYGLILYHTQLRRRLKIRSHAAWLGVKEIWDM